MTLLHKLVLIVLFLQFNTFSQDKNLSISHIPNSLRKKADVVIRFDKKEIVIKDEKSMTIKFSRTITVFNESGDQYIKTYKNYAKDSKVTKISATIYNQQGREIRKYKKKDFKDQSAIQGFYSDHRVKYINYVPRSYPYTINFSYEFKSGTTAFIPHWYPSSSYRIGVEHSEFVLSNEKQVPYKLKEYRFKDYNISNLSNNYKIHYVLKNMKPLKYEIDSGSFSEIAPHVIVCLENFTLKGHTAYGIKTWKDFGAWLRNNMYNTQLDLSGETKREILDLVKNEKNDYNKAKIVYEYMQKKTRYVYVGIGIGGWQPNEASEVDELSYGDCKGLSNYTKALLDIVGVKSNWTIVYARNKRDFEQEYMGLQGNHMILNLPYLNNNDDVWLECTSQTLPFGFLGGFTDDRDVLVLEEGGGIIKHTTQYLDKNNTRNTIATVVLDNEGHLKAQVSVNSKGLEYYDNYRLEGDDLLDVKKYYKSKRWWYNENIKINKHAFKNDKTQASFTEDLEIDMDSYGNILGDEMIVRLNVFNMLKKTVDTNKKRTKSFEIKRGYTHCDTINIRIPEGYSLISLPGEKSIENQFGIYQLKLFRENEDRDIKYIRKLYIKEGSHRANNYIDYQNFLQKIIALDNTKIALKKN
ncbi:DUF3857 domain-containing protein [Wenyingzhuangia sp. IMCC45533]